MGASIINRGEQNNTEIAKLQERQIRNAACSFIRRCAALAVRHARASGEAMGMHM